MSIFNVFFKNKTESKMNVDSSEDIYHYPTIDLLDGKESDAPPHVDMIEQETNKNVLWKFSVTLILRFPV